MNKGIYIALSGAILKAKQMDVFAQNLANANTTGYKKGNLAFKDHLVPTDNPFNVESKGRIMTEMSNEFIDFSAGPQKRTGNPLDVAINGEGFFALEGDRYTRNGNFKLDSEGNIVDQNGINVLGDGGTLTVQGSKIDISSSGEIFVDDISVGMLKIVDFPDKSVLVKSDGGFFTSGESGTEVKSGISQGYLEESNVNVVRELVEMMRTQREFESYQKMIRSFDEAAAKAINDL